MSRVKWVNLIPYPSKTAYVRGDHCVYLVYAQAADLYKIGWTGDIQLRLRHLPEEQRDICGPYRLIHKIDTACGRYLERQLHFRQEWTPEAMLPRVGNW